MNGIGVFSKPPLEIESAKTASFTADAGYIYPVDLSSVTADLTLTFKGSPAVDDRFAVYVSSTHSSGGTSTNFADRPYFCIEPANSTSINGSSYSATAGEGGSEYSMWLAGDYMEYFYDGSTWVTAGGRRGLQPHKAWVSLSTTFDIADSTTTAVEWDTDDIDNANVHSTSSNTERVYIKRGGSYHLTSPIRWENNDTGYRLNEIRDQSSTILCRDRRAGLAGSESSMSTSRVLSATNYVLVNAQQDNDTNINLYINNSMSQFCVTEDL